MHVHSASQICFLNSAEEYFVLNGLVYTQTPEFDFSDLFCGSVSHFGTCKEPMTSKMLL